MYENNVKRIVDAQNGNKDEMAKLIEENNRTHLEHSKKIWFKGI